MRTVLYLCYGNGPEADETIYSLLSAFRLSPPGTPRLRYVVYAEYPERFDGLGVEIRPFAAGELQAWMGGSDYIHRRKTMTILDALDRYPGAVAFVDCDTYFRRPPEALFERIAPGRSCLHVLEAKLLESGTAVDRALSDLVKLEAFVDSAGRPIPISPNAPMWNSGVVGVHSKDVGLMRETLHLIDQMWARLKIHDLEREHKVHHIEQFATGLMLGKNRLSSCRDVVFHYWPDNLRAPFRRILPDLLAESAGKPLGLRAQGAYARRPQADAMRKVKQGLRTGLRSLGVDVPGVSASA